MLTRQLYIDKVLVYGVSAGGLAAIELAASYPDRVEKLVLASAISKRWLHREDDLYRKAQILFKPKYQKCIWGLTRIFSRLSPMLFGKGLYSQFSKKSDPNLKMNDVQELICAFEKYSSGDGLINDLEQTINNDTLEKINCPTLIIHSKYDNSVSFEHAINSKNKIKNSVLEPLDNEWGHLFWIGRDSEESIKKIVRFTEN